MGKITKAAAIVLVLELSGCSLLVTRDLPAGYASSQGTEPPCSQSNWAAGVDLLATFVATLATFGTASDASNPRLTSSDSQGKYAAAVGFGTAAALSFYSMLVGFGRSDECRQATRAAGIASHGEYDWLIPPLVVLTVGVAAVMVRGGGGGGFYDEDRCSIGAVRTALCRDQWYSCSLNRSGTCSHHGGVALWL